MIGWHRWFRLSAIEKVTKEVRLAPPPSPARGYFVEGTPCTSSWLQDYVDIGGIPPSAQGQSSMGWILLSICLVSKRKFKRRVSSLLGLFLSLSMLYKPTFGKIRHISSNPPLDEIKENYLILLTLGPLGWCQRQRWKSQNSNRH